MTWNLPEAPLDDGLPDDDYEPTKEQALEGVSHGVTRVTETGERCGRPPSYREVSDEEDRPDDPLQDTQDGSDDPADYDPRDEPE